VPVQICSDSSYIDPVDFIEVDRAMSKIEAYVDTYDTTIKIFNETIFSNTTPDVWKLWPELIGIRQTVVVA